LITVSEALFFFPHNSLDGRREREHLRDSDQVAMASSSEENAIPPTLDNITPWL